MAQYLVRGWYGWHLNIHMVNLAMLLILQKKVAYRDCVPLLSDMIWLSYPMTHYRQRKTPHKKFTSK